MKKAHPYRFAERTNWPLSENAITEQLAALRAQAVEVYDLTASNPTACGFTYPAEALCAALSDARNLRYTPDPRGIVAAREVVAAYYRERGVVVPLEHIFLTASTSEGYSYLFRLLANAGERMAFPAPSYPLFSFLCDLHDVSMAYYQLTYRDRWVTSLDAIRACVTEDTRAITVVNPNNPTGSFLQPDERDALAEFCAGQAMPIISDEVFYDFSFDDTVARARFVGDGRALSFTVSGISKILGLPQMKLSWIVVDGPAAAVADACSRLEVIADTYLSVSAPVQNALAAWCAAAHAIRAQITDRVRQNYCFLRAQPWASHGAQVLSAQGGWYGIIRLPQAAGEEAFVQKLLETAQVFVHPGYFFDFIDGAHLVVSLLTPPDVFHAGIARVLRAVEDDRAR